MKKLTTAKLNRLSLLAYLRAVLGGRPQAEFTSLSEEVLEWANDAGFEGSLGHMLYWLKRDGFISEVKVMNNKQEFVSKKFKGRKVYRLEFFRDLSSMDYEEVKVLMDCGELPSEECFDDAFIAELEAKNDIQSQCIIHLLLAERAYRVMFRNRKFTEMGWSEELLNEGVEPDFNWLVNQDTRTYDEMLMDIPF